jgi:hypothetical protein
MTAGFKLVSPLFKTLIERRQTMTTLQYAAVIVTEGAEFIGIQRLPQGNLILFTDPQYRSTLAVAEREFSPEAVSLRLRDNKRKFTNPSGL